MTQKSDLFQIDVGNRMDFPHISIWTWSFCMSKRGGLPRRGGTGNRRWGRANSYFSSPMQSMRTGTLTPPEETGYLLIMAQPGCAGDYQNRLLTTYPVCPLVREEALHADVRYALNALSNGGQIRKARMSSSFFFQLILARILPVMEWENQEAIRSHSLTAQVIRYISQHYRENLSLETLSSRFGVSRYHLSGFFPDDPHWILCISPFSAGQLRQGAAAKLQS